MEMILCRCQCGVERRVRAINLRNGSSKSCGCLSVDTATKRLRTHGATGTPEYLSWAAMLSRCRNPKDKKHPHYGGRGIKVCVEWESFSTFRRDMGPRPFGTTLGRKDNDGNYEPGNCRWETPTQQSRNRSNTVTVAVHGMTRTATEWDQALGYKPGTVYGRLRRGWSPERAVYQTPRKSPAYSR
jgi:hypothetical protein